MNEHQSEILVKDSKDLSVLKIELRELIFEKHVNTFHPVVRAVAREVERKQPLEKILLKLKGRKN